MKAAAVPAPSFAGQSPVSAYWLRQCEGFSVRSGWRRGRVVDVVFGPDHRYATFVVVRLGLFRSSVVPVEAVEAVIPATQLVVLHSPRRRRVLQVPWLGRTVEAVAAVTPPAAAAFARTCLRFG